MGQSEDPVNIELEYAGLIKPDELHLLNLLASGYTYADAAKELNSTPEACRKGRREPALYWKKNCDEQKFKK